MAWKILAAASLMLGGAAYAQSEGTEGGVRLSVPESGAETRDGIPEIEGQSMEIDGAGTPDSAEAGTVPRGAGDEEATETVREAVEAVREDAPDAPVVDAEPTENWFGCEPGTPAAHCVEDRAGGEAASAAN
jgi:hypothetical protein